MDFIVGTAGHIDHGKTALVKALTGVDADRLPEEKRRGITVDIGFAEMTAGDIHFGFVDVPGHERFVKNMLAGASGIDLVLFVVAADEGVMPQTREHFEICRLLGLTTGVIAVTKSDLVDDETLQLARLDVAELVAGSFLDQVPIIPVSARGGSGLNKLIDALSTAARSLPPRTHRYVTRLAVDRSFSMKGFGAVVTGTLASGEIREGAELELLPAGQRVRVRGLQTHGRTVSSARAGQRTAVNLGGIAHTDIYRGMVLTEPGVLTPTQAIDAHVEVLATSPRPLRSRQRVRVHLGTAEVLARVQVIKDGAEIAAGQKGFVQLRLETSAIAIMGERFIIRSYSPQVTIAGGEIVDPLAGRHRRRDFNLLSSWLEGIRSGTDVQRVELLTAATADKGVDKDELRSRTGFASDVLDSALSPAVREKRLVECDGYYISRASFDKLCRSTQDAIATFHKREPLAKGIAIDELRSSVLAQTVDAVSRAVLRSLGSDIVVDKETVRLASHQTELTPAETAFMNALRDIYRHAGIEVPKTADAVTRASAGTTLSSANVKKLLYLLYDSGELVRVNDEIAVDAAVIKALVERVREHAGKTNDRVIDVAAFKDIAGVSRKYAIPLLEYFDRERITARAGANRVVL